MWGLIPSAILVLLKRRSHLRRLLWEGKLTPVVDRVLPLDQAREAQRLLEEGRQFGKVVLEVK